MSEQPVGTRVSINPARCQGHAMCWIVAPTVFDVDDSGRGLVAKDVVTAEDEKSVAVAVARCPEKAISLV